MFSERLVEQQWKAASTSLTKSDILNVILDNNFAIIIRYDKDM